MSDSLLTLLEMIEEVLEEAKRDVVPGTTFKLVPADKASEKEREIYGVQSEIIIDSDGTPKEIEVVRVPTPLKTNTGLAAEKHLKTSLETHFQARGLTGYTVGDPQGSGPNPDVVASTPKERIAFEVKNTPSGLVDYGQSDLYFDNGQWVLVSDNPHLEESFKKLRKNIFRH